MQGAVILAALLDEESKRFILPNWHEMVWAGLAFLILVGFMAKVAFPAMRKGLDARSDKIRSSIEGAEKSKADAEAVLNQYRERLAEARGEANKIIEEAKRTADALRRDLVVRAETEAGEIVQRARGEVASERDRALAELRATIGELSITLATKVIERELTNETAQRAYVDQTIAELTAIGNGNSR